MFHFPLSSFVVFRLESSAKACAMAFLVLLMVGCSTPTDDAATQNATTPNESPASKSTSSLPLGLKPEYVGNEVCISCHQMLGERWRGSYHAKAMDFATPETVVGDFQNAQCTHGEEVARFFQKDGAFWAALDSPQTEYPIKYVIGFYPLQQYMVEFPDGRIQCLPYAWDVDGKKWYHLYPDEKIPVGDLLHWRQPAQNWNAVCASCHTTGLKRNFSFEKNAFHTTFVEMNVGCESCHGPGSLHVEMAKKRAEETQEAEVSPASRLRDPHYGFGFFTFEGADGPTATDACSTCHARRREIYPGFQPGAKFSDFYFPELLDTNAFYPDGQIREEVYEYSSFLQSKFYAIGGSCSDCHDRFIAKAPQTIVSGETKPPTVLEMCGKCHDPEIYDTPKHHFHNVAQSVEGTRCEDCHMPKTTYMGVDDRRDHAISIPRPQLTLDLEIPNACNRCHTNETPQWALDACQRWYGADSASGSCFIDARSKKKHFAYSIDAGRKGLPNAESGLIQVLQDETLPPIVCASAASLLETYSGAESKKALLHALSHKSELVRSMAARSLEGKFSTPEECVRTMAPLLRDPARCVRLEVVRLLIGLRLPPHEKTLYDAVLREYFTSLENLPEEPASHFNFGVYHERTGNLRAAEAAYRRALTLSPLYFPARNNLGMLLYAQQRKDEAEAQFREMTKRNPDRADGWYSLGLLISEETLRLPEAVECFQKAGELAPYRARIFYNLGVANWKIGRLDAALEALKRATTLEPQNPEFSSALQRLEALRQRESRGSEVE
ncbi:MAG: tetratricopeptide repeat protein [Planctomycetia bacterium]|nr:tetratricopeptide repeat protein [Planctomycetia bacterium]